MNQSSRTVLSVFYFRAIQLLITLGLILSIVGGTSSISSTGVYKVQTTSEAGVILYIVTYVALGLMTAVTLWNATYVASAETRLMWAVIVAMPLILVRLIYSLLVVFQHSHTFNIVSGSATVFGVMAVMEEIGVVLIYLFVGWTTDAAPKSAERPIASRPWKGSSTAGAERRRTHGMRQGPIHGLVGLALTAAKKNRDDIETV